MTVADEHARAVTEPGKISSTVAGESTGRPRWERPALLGLLALTAALYLWALASAGWANNFYAAAVRAGTEDSKAWLFGSLDPGNAITVDKPPASLWVMVLSARLFGFSSWSMLLPQALMGVGSVALVYSTVRRWGGSAAALLSATVMALTPVAAVMFRYNNPDALLVLLLVGAAYCTVRATETGAVRWILLAGKSIGFAFLMKLLQAFLIACLGVGLPVRRARDSVDAACQAGGGFGGFDLVGRVVRRVGKPMAAIAVVAMVIGVAAPAAYTIDTVAHPHKGGLPTSGPHTLGSGAGPGNGPGGGQPGSQGADPADNEALQSLIKTSHARWAAAAISAMTAGPLELNSGASVMAVGGFSGHDPYPSPAQFQRYVSDRQIRYFIIGGTRGRGDEPDSSTAVITRWVQQNFVPVNIAGTTVYDLSAPHN